MIVPPDIKSNAQQWLLQGRRAKAIEYLRTTLQVDLAQATKLVESLESEYRPKRALLSGDPARIVGTVFSCLGAIFTIVSVFLYWKDMKDTSHSVRIQGTVTELRYHSGGSSVPVIRYRYLGKEKTYVGSVASSPPAFEVDETVDLLVNDQDPRKVIVDTFLERYFLIAFFALFAIVFGGVGLLILVFLKN